jgi:peptidoglycan/LPS O-acetylase OafA/YrhL
MKTTSERRYDVDWLRVLAVLLLIPYHTAVIFTRLYVAYIKSEPNAAMEAFAYFMNQWHMALLFLVSGVGAWYSLESRSARRFAGERVKRLVVPLIFGTLAVVPVQVYFQRLYYHDFSGSFTRFYPHFFDGIYPHGNFTWGQLWFLAYLFVFSLLLMPAFMFFKSASGRRALARLAAFCERPGGLFAGAIPLMLAQAAFRAKWPGFQNLYNDWANFALYITVFLYGYILISAPGFQRAIQKNHGISLLLGVASMSVILFLRQSGNAPQPNYSGEWILYMLLHGFSSWCWLVGFLGLAQRHLSFNNRVLEYANEAALPFYILHHAAIVTVAYYVVRWEAAIAAKFGIISICSLLLALCAYDTLVKRVGIFRFLFGMRAKPRLLVHSEQANRRV